MRKNINFSNINNGNNLILGSNGAVLFSLHYLILKSLVEKNQKIILVNNSREIKLVKRKEITDLFKKYNAKDSIIISSDELENFKLFKSDLDEYYLYVINYKHNSISREFLNQFLDNKKLIINAESIYEINKSKLDINKFDNIYYTTYEFLNDKQKETQLLKENLRIPEEKVLEVKNFKPGDCFYIDKKNNKNEKIKIPYPFE